jgi:hypothetical protein
MTKMNDAYYEKLHQKVNKFGYTIMSIVSDEPESSEHAAYCYTIGLSNYGYPEIMLADCCYGDVVELSDILLDKASDGYKFDKNIVLQVADTDSKFKAIELLKGIKEELTEQAKHYFHLFRPEDENYHLIYIGKADEFGIFPDEKIFVESKHIKKMFYKLIDPKYTKISNLVLPQPSTVQ